MDACACPLMGYRNIYANNFDSYNNRSHCIFVVYVLCGIRLIYDAFSIVSNPADPNYGKLDTATIFSNNGLTSTQIQGVESVVSAIKDVKTNALNAINNTAGALKALRR